MQKVLLCILDGWGYRKETDHNAIYHAQTPTWDRMLKQYSHSLLETGGEAVGLPAGQMGNSEVGHMTIGSGRVLLQDLPLINKAVAEDSIANMPLIIDTIKTLKASGKALHLTGLLSNGGVHSHLDHIIYLANLFADNGIKVYLHAIFDGRDVAQKSAHKYVEQLQNQITSNLVTIATCSGRYYIMDRDKRWERVEPAYNAVINGTGERANNIMEIIDTSYTNDITDEFIKPTIIGDYAGANDGDAFIIANFRADRVRQLSASLFDNSFTGFNRDKTINFSNKIGITEYSTELNAYMDTLFPPSKPEAILPEIIANAGLKQLRIAETEKYAHVTFFMSGGNDDLYKGEERILVPSPKVATYDLQPEMSAPEVTAKLTSAMQDSQPDLIICNYANGDMVGHSGDFEAAKKAAEALDTALTKLEQTALDNDYIMLVTADHGNAEEMEDHKGNPHTQHSLNPVPFVYVSKGNNPKLSDGTLADIAPTILNIMGLDAPSQMDGKNLIQ